MIKTGFLTGGAGCIKSHVSIALLQADFYVAVLDNLKISSPEVTRRVAQITGRDPSFVQEDIRDETLLKQLFTCSNFSAILHFASLEAVGEYMQQFLRYYDLLGVQVEVMSWTEASEVDNIRACDVEIMPLHDSLWERGKCGCKLIQYMACGLPVVACGVGVNPVVVRNGENGFLASTSEEWLAHLHTLLSDPALRMQMGQEGRLRVEAEYCIQQTGPKMARHLQLSGGIC